MRTEHKLKDILTNDYLLRIPLAARSGSWCSIPA